MTAARLRLSYSSELLTLDRRVCVSYDSRRCRLGVGGSYRRQRRHPVVAGDDQVVLAPAAHAAAARATDGECARSRRRHGQRDRRRPARSRLRGNGHRPRAARAAEQRGAFSNAKRQRPGTVALGSGTIQPVGPVRQPAWRQLVPGQLSKGLYRRDRGRESPPPHRAESRRGGSRRGHSRTTGRRAVRSRRNRRRDQYRYAARQR